MKKRFTDCDKWNDPWYMDLKPIHKLLWQYLCDRCDNAGVWVVNEKLADAHIGDSLDWKDALDVMSGRVEVIDGGRKWHLRKFVSFQYPNGLNANSYPQADVLRLLAFHKIEGKEETTLPGRVVSRVLGTLKDKDRDSSSFLRGSAEGGASKPDWHGALAELALPCSPSAIKDWKAYFRELVVATSFDEVRAFLRWVVSVAERKGVPLQYPRQAGEAAARDWRDHHQSKFQRQA